MPRNFWIRLLILSGLSGFEDDVIVFLIHLDARSLFDAELFAERGGDDDLPLLGSTSFGSFHHTRKV